MRYGVISDVHANLHALRATVAELHRRGVDGWLCAGDLIGYGAHPDECVEILAELGATSVHGNHELMLLGRLSRMRCGPDGREALLRTDAVLRDETRAALEALPAEVRGPQLLMTHAALGDADRYLQRPEDADEQLDRLRHDHPGARLLVVGHTHHPWVRGPAGTLSRGGHDASVALTGDGPFLLNPGSVGQSRTREHRPLARSMLLDLDAGRVTPIAVAYDDRAARTALRAARLAPDNIQQLRGVGPAVARRARRVVRRLTAAGPASRGGL